MTWNNGRRFTSPGPAPVTNTRGILETEGPLGNFYIESYLDKHPEFLDSYVLRKVKPGTVERWHLLQQPLAVPGELAVSLDTNTALNSLESDSAGLSRQGSFRQTEGFYAEQVRTYHSADCTPMPQRSFSSTPRRRKSAAVTPHRKISAATFEDGCQSPILKQEMDGSMSFLTIPPISYGQTCNLQMERRDSVASGLSQSGDSDLWASGLSSLSDMHDSVTSDMNQSSLCFKIAMTFSHLSNAVSTTVLQVKGVGAETYFLGSAINVSKENSEDVMDYTPHAIPQEMQTFLIGVINNKKSVTIDRKELKDRSGEHSFLENNDFDTLAILLLIGVDEKIQGIALLSLKEKSSAEKIMENKLITDIAKLSGICLRNASDYHSKRLELTRSQVFLELARVIFDNQMSIEFTVLKMLVNFLNLIECERAQIQLSSKDKPTEFHKCYDLEENDLKKENFEKLVRPFENRFPQNSSTVGIVASKGQTFLKNSCEAKFDDEDHFDTRSLLCMPIRDGDRNIIGVVSLVNKKTGIFTANDESFVEAFGIFCGIALANVSNYEQLKTAEARKQVALDIMTYHATSSTEEVRMLSKMTLPPVQSAKLYDFSFTETELEDLDTLTASLKMFHGLELTKIFQLDHTVLCRWLLTVKKNYRPEVVYHNWRHAFAVSQVMYSCLIHSGWWEHLGPSTCLGLLIACLCHDVDHRGTNNNYLLATNSPLAMVYSSSTLERHHLSQALIILNLDGHRILDTLSPAEYSKTICIIEHAILATDLSLHFSHLGRLMRLSSAGAGGLDWTSQESVEIVSAALMTASDLGASAKPWEYQQRIAGLVAEEFWYQGDLEKAELSSPLRPQFDRELRHELPKLQVGFCQGVCLPVYKALGDLSPQLRPLEKAVKVNRDKWEELSRQQEETRNL